MPPVSGLGDVIDVVLRTLIALGVPGAGVWYLRERRKSRAADEVAEQTVPAEVRIKDADALNAHIAAVERAFEVERDSKDRRIAEQSREIRELKSGRKDDAERIAALSAEVRELRDQVDYLRNVIEKISTRHPEEAEEHP